MNRRAFEAYLRAHGCGLHRHGAKHDVWMNPLNNSFSMLPRHRTISKPLARAICRQLDVPIPGS